MPFNISTFMTNGLVYGGTRPSLFNVTLSVPGGLGISATNVSQFTLMCKAGDLPGMDIAPIDVAYFGRKIKVAGDRPSYPGWKVTCMNDEDFTIRAIMEVWNNAINAVVANVRQPSVSEEAYKADLMITQFGKDGTELRQYTMYGAWPSSIDPISVDWDSTNSIETFGVNFAYDYWLPSIETSSKASSTGTSLSYGLTTPGQTDGPNGPN